MNPARRPSQRCCDRRRLSKSQAMLRTKDDIIEHDESRESLVAWIDELDEHYEALAVNEALVGEERDSTSNVV